MRDNGENGTGPRKEITRRSVLDWLGKAAVLGLGSDFLLACEERFDSRLYGAHPEDGRPQRPALDGSVASDAGGLIDEQDSGSGDAAPGSGTGAEDSGAPEEDAGGFRPDFAFEPGPEKPIYEGFQIYTVDPQDLASILEHWTLRVDGLVEQPLVLSFFDLLRLERANQTTDFHCTVGWSVLDVPWNGVRLSTILEMAGPRPAATHATFHTITDVYNESLTLAEALEPKTILAFGVGGSTLPLDHGFPLRLVIPRKLGYKNAKYVYRVELDDKPVSGFWVEAGYPYAADVPADRLRPGKY